MVFEKDSHQDIAESGSCKNGKVYYVITFNIYLQHSKKLAKGEGKIQKNTIFGLTFGIFQTFGAHQRDHECI